MLARFSTHAYFIYTHYRMKIQTDSTVGGVKRHGNEVLFLSEGRFLWPYSRLKLALRSTSCASG